MREKNNYTMKELPESEKPYEKCVRLGAGALSDAELLAVIIRTGTTERTSLSLAMDVLKLLSGSHKGQGHRTGKGDSASLRRGAVQTPCEGDEGKTRAAGFALGGRLLFHERNEVP